VGATGPHGGTRHRSTLGCVLGTFLRPKWLALHALALVLVVTFLGLGWWQLRRAGEGNVLSVGYAVEWPLFAGFTVFVWVRLIRDRLRPPGSGGGATGGPAQPGPALPVLPPRPAAPVPEPDEELAAYNRYLASLHTPDDPH
jgi:hypothetical protein